MENVYGITYRLQSPYNAPNFIYICVFFFLNDLNEPTSVVSLIHSYGRHLTRRLVGFISLVRDVMILCDQFHLYRAEFYLLA